MEDGRSNLCKGNSCYGQAKLPLERSWKANNVPFTKENKYVILPIGCIGQNGQERDKLKSFQAEIQGNRHSQIQLPIELG